ncbi:MAG: hypothetical protein IH933_05105 [Euryarchaeota archaeon]|jgi:Arc/MetJ-type ribon-helix-helix transcriptional regulator|nr:hypothetical protein [Euryarchaeota archaeon]
MGTTTIKLPDEMDSEVEAYLDANPYYVSKSEFVRDAIRDKLTIRSPAISEEYREKIQRGKEDIKAGRYTHIDDL